MYQRQNLWWPRSFEGNTFSCHFFQRSALMLNINSVTFVWLFFTAYGNVHSRSCLSSESFCLQTEYTARLLLLWFALICILPSVIPRNDEICQYIASSSWLRYIPFYQLGVVCQPRPQNQMANSPVVIWQTSYTKLLTESQVLATHMIN